MGSSSYTSIGNDCNIAFTAREMEDDDDYFEEKPESKPSVRQGIEDGDGMALLEDRQESGHLGDKPRVP